MRRVALSLSLLVIFGLAISTLITLLYILAPRSNADLTRVDVLIVLGCPTEPDGSPAAEQRERVDESIREFDRGVSSHLIMAGGAGYNRFVEAHAMAALAQTGGVPLAAITEETLSKDTIQNIYFSNAIMKTNRWETAEVISSPSHLARASLILKHYPALRWKTHAARWPKTYTLGRRSQLYALEAIKSFDMRLMGLGSFQYLPAF